MTIRVALFCPHLSGESDADWKVRLVACRAYLRQFPKLEVFEFDCLTDLQTSRHTFRRVLGARMGYYPLEFWNWKIAARVDTLDVLDRPMSGGLREHVQQLTRQEKAVQDRRV